MCAKAKTNRWDRQRRKWIEFYGFTGNRLHSDSFSSSASLTARSSNKISFSIKIDAGWTKIGKNVALPPPWLATVALASFAETAKSFCRLRNVYVLLIENQQISVNFNPNRSNQRLFVQAREKRCSWSWQYVGEDCRLLFCHFISVDGATTS